MYAIHKTLSKFMLLAIRAISKLRQILLSKLRQAECTAILEPSLSGRNHTFEAEFVNM